MQAKTTAAQVKQAQELMLPRNNMPAKNALTNQLEAVCQLSTKSVKSACEILQRRKKLNEIVFVADWARPEGQYETV